MIGSPPTTSVIGLGKVGICLAAALAQAQVPVLGFDSDARRRDALLKGDTTSTEPGLNRLLALHRERLAAAGSTEDAVHGSEVSFVVVPTPSTSSGAFSTEHLSEACDGIGDALRRKAAYHLIVLVSTVSPGDTRRELLPRLEATSGKRCGADFGLCYSPAFIALGQVLRDFLSPAFVLIGESDTRAGAALEAAYRHLVDEAVPRLRMSLENAELTKLAVNTFVTTKITYANMLSDLCEALPGGEVDTVLEAVGHDPRIGASCLRGGLGYGGPCFPRDNAALAAFARREGVLATLAETTDRENRARPARIIDRLPDNAIVDRDVGVLGLAYKPGTQVVDDSQAIELANRLATRARTVRVFDPQLPPDAAVLVDRLDSRITTCADLAACVEDADTIVLATPDPTFETVARALEARGEKGVTVIDVWRQLRRRDAPQGVEIVRVGEPRKVPAGDRDRSSGAEQHAPTSNEPTESVRLSVVSWPYAPGSSVSHNLDHAIELLRSIEPGSTDIACLPEGFLSHGVHDAGGGAPESLLSLDVGPVLGEEARRLDAMLAVPTAERTATGRPGTVVVLLDRKGECFGRYHKMHPWPCDPDLARLEFGSLPGQGAPVFSTDFGPIGVQTCFDVHFEPGWRQIEAAGAKLVLFPSAYPAGFALRARAWQCQAPIASSVLGGGPARVVDLDGSELLRAPSLGGPRTLSVNLNTCLVHRDHNETFLSNLARKHPELSIQRLPDDNVVRIAAPPGWGSVERFVEKHARTLRSYLRDAGTAIDSATKQRQRSAV